MRALAAPALLVLLAGAGPQPTPADELLAARERAYTANFQNDQAGLRAAIDVFTRLSVDDRVAPFAHYYAGWAHWALSASQLAGNEGTAALASAERSEAEMRAAIALRGDLSDFHTGLTNALISVAILGNRFQAVGPDMFAARRRALELDPRNPRAVIMDAGIIFNTPADRGGSQQKGIDRWLEAIALLEQEQKARNGVDPLMPDWGMALAHGWLSQTYLNATPPRIDDARRMAEAALQLRPDFWFVKTQILPKLR